MGKGSLLMLTPSIDGSHFINRTLTKGIPHFNIFCSDFRPHPPPQIIYM